MRNACVYASDNFKSNKDEKLCLEIYTLKCMFVLPDYVQRMYKKVHIVVGLWGTVMWTNTGIVSSAEGTQG